jgi:signal transduction histidine kinase
MNAVKPPMASTPRAMLRPAEGRLMCLGLFISKSIIEGHGGQIWAESVPGQGTTFHVTLPAPIVAVAAPSATSAA